MTNYYSENFEKFIDDTFNCDMSNIYQFFERCLNKDARCILDLGFGSGRDSIYFSKKYETYSIDPEIKFCNHGKELGLKNIFQLSVLDMNFESKFDGIWACASLLHVNREDLKKAFHNCYNALKKRWNYVFFF